MVLACAKPAVIVPLTSVRFTAHLILFFQLPEMMHLVPFSRGLWCCSTPSEASKVLV